jgi:iron complex outermembrane receptor protein
MLSVMLVLVFVLPAAAQQTDSIWNVALENVTITADSYEKTVSRNSVLSVEVAGKEFLTGHFTGNLVQALEYISGVRSMDIGSGFSKPMIRGMGFNRIAVTEHGIKQESQQWGSDHGLEIDAFNIERVTVRKGPSSLLYGSDAIGGVIEITAPPAPADDRIFGEAGLLHKSVNGGLGASMMLGMKKGPWYVRARYSEQRFGDYRVPTDTVVYLTQRMPVYGRRLKNTAGWERHASLYTEYRRGSYYANYTVSNAYQKTGFFPGAHGVPDISRVQDDGNRRNVEYPFSRVNHLKATTRQQYSWHGLIASWDLGYQNNHREEWSKFHTHYGTQPPPERDPDKELEFSLNTFTSTLKLRVASAGNWEHTAGWDMQLQQNRIGGYSYLLPRYDRFTTGLSVVSAWRPSPVLSISGGLRYDLGTVDISASTDPYLENWLKAMGYDDALIGQYRRRSYPVDRRFGDFSGSVGLSWNPEGRHQLKANIGHSFRLPGANELAANGVHHGAFRHEQGDPSLSSERGWQLDASYRYAAEGFSLSAGAFSGWFGNYIYLRPTGEWSVLPHTGQIYRYTGAAAILMGGELSLDVDLPFGLNYAFMGEYVYTHNRDEHTALAFSPPASMHNTLAWKGGKLQAFAEVQSIAGQARIAKNEDPTGGAHLLHLGGGLTLTAGRWNAEVTLSIRNLFDTRYYNHLSFYRRVEIPEPGRNLQLFIRIPFNYHSR